MARVTNFEEYEGVGFFSLKNDGDEAVVRIMEDSVENFDIYSIHKIKSGNRWMNIDCPRTGHDALNMCPLCAKGEKLTQKIFIKILNYTKDSVGNITSHPCVWERPISYATKLKNYINEYGPLSESVFKIRRNGAAGSLETTYEILYGNPKVYTEEIYKKDFNAFSDFNVIGTMIYQKTNAEMLEYLRTGQFPSNNKNDSQQSNNYNNQQNNGYATVPQNQAPAGWGNANQGVYVENMQNGTTQQMSQQPAMAYSPQATPFDVQQSDTPFGVPAGNEPMPFDGGNPVRTQQVQNADFRQQMERPVRRYDPNVTGTNIPTNN